MGKGKEKSMVEKEANSQPDIKQMTTTGGKKKGPLLAPLRARTESQQRFNPAQSTYPTTGSSENE